MIIPGYEQILTLSKYQNFTKFSGVEILWKRTVSVEFRVIQRLCVSAKFMQQEIS